MGIKVAKTGTRHWDTATDWVGDVAPVALEDVSELPNGCDMIADNGLPGFTFLRMLSGSTLVTPMGMEIAAGAYVYLFAGSAATFNGHPSIGPGGINSGYLHGEVGSLIEFLDGGQGGINYAIVESNGVVTLGNPGSQYGLIVMQTSGQFTGEGAGGLIAYLNADLNGATPMAQFDYEYPANAGMTLDDEIETGVTVRQALQRVGAIAAGKVSGARTGTETFLGLDGVTPRVQVETDAAGNRTAVTYDPEPA
jgi:hypothetical protein